jgi:flagellar motor switch protein FliG
MRTGQFGIPNRRKAAIMLMVLGNELSGKVMPFLADEHVEQLTLEVARLDKVSPELRNKVIEDFHGMAVAQDYIAEGGVEHAKKLLEAAFGADKASELIGRVNETLRVVPFDFLRRSDPSQLLTFVADEHPQTIALVLAYLPTQLAGQVLGRLNPDLRADVAERIAMMDRTPPDVIERVEAVLEKKFSSVSHASLTAAGGAKALAELLNQVDRTTERGILEALQNNNPEVAKEVMNMMFVFEDIVQLDDRAVQQILREIEMKDLALALKGTDESVQSKIYKNMSERAAEMVKEDMEFMGPVKIRTVEEAQQKVVAVIRRLEESGEISLGRGEEELLV